VQAFSDGCSQCAPTGLPVNREQGWQRLLAFLGLGDQTPLPIMLTPRESQVVANALDVAACEHRLNAGEELPAECVDDVLADAEHIADLMMLRERFLQLHQEDA
jgi:hypothetical protein